MRGAAFCLFLTLSFPGEVFSNDRQDLVEIKKAVTAQLAREIQGLPGVATFTVGQIDPRLSLPACPSLQAARAAGAAPWGRTSISVRCGGPVQWQIYVPATIQVVAEYAVTARPLLQGQPITAGDIAMQKGDLAQLPAGIVTVADLAVGKTAGISVAAGQPLRQDMLRLPVLVQQGQSVRVVARGKGFAVSSEGRALTNAVEGQVVQVRTSTGQNLSGVARPGPQVDVGGG